ncbi:Protein patched-like 1 [Porphyridium purpureum]|uniref:Protein patched-like 1 n=1 Tax=Porphyridium purpureum TaxID=35688 RepID=A0A5J4YRZ0_PORPP|nr:Protein patched-like 1 [Porphyridium purpureum]|eukprot:POR2556..scf236_6
MHRAQQSRLPLVKFFADPQLQVARSLRIFLLVLVRARGRRAFVLTHVRECSLSMALQRVYALQARLQAKLENACGAYGAFWVTGGWWRCVPVLVAAALAASLIAGMSQLTVQQDVNKLWVLEGTQLENDRAFYESRFGGLDRTTSLVISNTEREANSLTPEQLRALHGVSSQLLSPSSVAPGPQVKVLMDVQPSGVNTTPALAFQNDFSVQLQVPSLLRPGVSFPITDLNFLSYAYQQITQCLADNNALRDVSDPAQPLEPLAEKWGISEFPTVRNSPLDCYREGSFDYPADLKELDRVARSVYYAKNNLYADVGINTSETYETCKQPLLVYFTTLFTFQGYPPAQAAELGAQFVYGATDLQTDQFATWGYSWRPRFDDMTEEDLLLHLQEAMQNAANESVTPLDCSIGGASCCLSWNAFAVDFETFIGDLRYNNQGALEYVGFLRSGFIGANSNEEAFAMRVATLFGATTEAERQALVLDWESNVISYFLPMHERAQSTDFAPGRIYADSLLNFYTTKSSDDVAEEGNRVPVGLIVASYAVMTVYTSLSFLNYSRPVGWRNVVYSRLVVAWCGLVSVALATLCGFGVLSWANVAISPVGINLAPFLSLGVGLDDIFVVAGGLIESGNLQNTPEERMRAVMRAAGPSVMLTTFANMSAFFIASSVRIPALYSFCYQIGTTLGFNLIFLFLFFVPCCAADCLRVQARMQDLFLWSCVKLDPETIPDELEAKKTSPFSLGRFASDVLGPKILLRSVWSKLAVLGVTLAFLVPIIVLGALRSQSGLPLSEVALEGSYQAAYVTIQEQYFTGYVSWLVTENVTFQDPQVQTAMLQQQLAIEMSKHASDQPSLRQTSWFSNSTASFLGSVNLPMGMNVDTPADSNSYYESFFQWTQTAGTGFENDIWCYNSSAEMSSDDGNGLNSVPCVQYSFATLETKLGGTRQQFIQSGLTETEYFVDAINSARDAASQTNVDGNRAFVYGYIYEFWEQYVDIYATLYQVVGFSLLGVSIVTALLMMSAWCAFLVVLLCLVITLELYGISTLVGIRVNAVSITNYAISIGMAVEFTAHYTHAFRTQPDGNRTDRAVRALGIMLAPATNGMASTILALFPLLGSEFEFIRRYYFGMLFTMVMLAYLNGMILLPVVMSLVGPPCVKSLEPKEHSGDDASDGASDCPERAVHGGVDDIAETDESLSTVCPN